MKFYFKNGKIFWISNFSFIWRATLLNNSSYEPNGIYVSGFTFFLHQEGPKKPKLFFSLSSLRWNKSYIGSQQLWQGKQIMQSLVIQSPLNHSKKKGHQKSLKNHLKVTERSSKGHWKVTERSSKGHQKVIERSPKCHCKVTKRISKGHQKVVNRSQKVLWKVKKYH